jgi:replicative DNA helicase
MATIEDSLRRVPPQSLDAEQSVLGGILLDNTALDRLVEVLQAEDFYREAHRKIFRGMQRLSERSEPVDLITLSEELRGRGELADVGGAAYLGELAERVPTAANILQYARIVRDKAILRGLITTATGIAARGYDPGQDVKDLVERAEQEIFAISDREVRPAFVRIDALLGDAFRKIDRLHDQRTPVTGVPTGFADLDKLTAGLQPSDLVIVGGRPSMGKTAFCLNVAEHAALRADCGVAVFSLEMSKEQLAMRMLCSEARVDLSRVRTGHLTDREFRELAEAAARLSYAPVYVDDTPAMSVLELRAKARRLHRDPAAKLKLVVVDYLQLMRSSEGKDSREQEISEISRSLKALAKELNVPVVALSQLNRQVESRDRGKPRLADLRECVTGDTRVVLADGRWVPIRELVGTAPQVLAVSEDQKIGRAAADKVWCVGRRKVFDIRLASGRSLRATGLHRLLGAHGWVRVETLSAGDRLALARRLPEPERTVHWALDTLPRELFEQVKAAMASRGTSQRAMAAARGTSYGGASHCRFAPSRATLSSYARILESDPLRRAAESDLFWDRVVEVIPAGEEDVFDLTVPGPACWLADGIVSHNSGAIEQDADVILFIYREEVYVEDTEKQGVAEIIVAKQRNGPIGSVELTFLREYTRFENREVLPDEDTQQGRGR